MTVFQLTPEDVQRSSTLEESDIGRWATIRCGCINFIAPSCGLCAHFTHAYHPGDREEPPAEDFGCLHEDSSAWHEDLGDDFNSLEEVFQAIAGRCPLFRMGGQYQ